MKIHFDYPFMIFHKCNCLKQNFVNDMIINNTNEGIELSCKVRCSLCGKETAYSYNISKEDTVDLSQDFNAYKIVPSIKDEIALVKLDNIKAKIKSGKLHLYGNYTNLRFFDNVVENVIIPLEYRKTIV